MKKYVIWSLIIIVFAGLGVYLLSNGKEAPNVKAQISVSKALSGDNNSGFERAVSPRNFSFPSDHGAHNSFRSEWWYFTGNLETKQGRHFGYQFTIFRTAVTADSIRSLSGWRTNQIYMGHFTLTDVQNNQFYAFERFSRGAEGLAGADASPFKVWLLDWQVKAKGENIRYDLPQLNLTASDQNIAIYITLESLKPIVFQGNKGLSQKGPEEGNASYYYSAPRLMTKGKIQLGGEQFDVTGLSWMDREWSTSALSKDQAGWDWFSLQLNDGREVMYYQMREKDGRPDQFSNGVVIDKDGNTKPLKPEQVELSVLQSWQSPLGGIYPSGWRLKIPEEKMDLEITPYIKDQELNVSLHYWEGAVKISGTSAGKNLQGSGYVELTGYEKEL
ncbi:MAG: lipocalin-like domain-containing protein [Bacillota bacterium]